MWPKTIRLFLRLLSCQTKSSTTNGFVVRLVTNRACSLGGMAAAFALCAAALIFAAPAGAQDDSAAQVLAAEGQVSVWRNGQAWALFEGNSVAVGQTIITGDDGFAQLETSDGSTFLVYPDSRVVFRKNPGSLSDLIDIFLGRVKVSIRRFGGLPNPHRIFSPTAVISVRGTIFDVAVAEDETTTVSVEEGLVGVEHRLMPRGAETPVSAGQSLTVYPSSPLAQAGVDKLKVAQVAEDAARIAASIWQRVARTNTPTGGSSPTGGSLPGDTPAPPAPLPGDTEAPEAPSPPPAP